MAARPQLILHEDPISANCYKIRLTAALLGVPLERRSYSILKGETRTNEFLRSVSSFGRIPVLQVGSGSPEKPIFLPESNAACFYLADTAAVAASAAESAAAAGGLVAAGEGGEAPSLSSPSSSRSLNLNLIPTDPLQRAEMLRWMFFEQNQHEVNIATLRYWLHYLGHENLDQARRAQIPGKIVAGRQVLDCMQEHLASTANDSRGGGGGGWFVGDGITLADVVLFAYTHVAHQGGFDLAEWPAVRNWCDRVTRVDGFVPMV